MYSAVMGCAPAPAALQPPPAPCPEAPQARLGLARSRCCPPSARIAGRPLRWPPCPAAPPPPPAGPATHHLSRGARVPAIHEHVAAAVRCSRSKQSQHPAAAYRVTVSRKRQLTWKSSRDSHTQPVTLPGSQHTHCTLIAPLSTSCSFPGTAPEPRHCMSQGNRNVAGLCLQLRKRLHRGRQLAQLLVERRQALLRQRSCSFA